MEFALSPQIVRKNFSSRWRRRSDHTTHRRRPSARRVHGSELAGRGLLRVGDILTGVADTPLGANITRGLLGPPVIDEVAILQPGTTVTLQFIRNGQPSHITLRLAQWGTVANATADIGPAAL